MRAASTADTSRSKRQRVIAGDDDDVDDKGSDNDEDDIDAIIANAIEADGAFDDNRDVDAPDEGVANNDDNGENNDDDDAQIDLSKINTKLTAAEKRNLFALVMDREHQRLKDDVESIKGSWHMHEECLSKKTQDEVSRIVSVRLLLTTRYRRADAHWVRRANPANTTKRSTFARKRGRNTLRGEATPQTLSPTLRLPSPRLPQTASTTTMCLTTTDTSTPACR